jgi:hypothetical protein
VVPSKRSRAFFKKPSLKIRIQSSKYRKRKLYQSDSEVLSQVGVPLLIKLDILARGLEPELDMAGSVELCDDKVINKKLSEVNLKNNEGKLKLTHPTVSPSNIFGLGYLVHKHRVEYTEVADKLLTMGHMAVDGFTIDGSNVHPLLVELRDSWKLYRDSSIVEQATESPERKQVICMARRKDRTGYLAIELATRQLQDWAYRVELGGENVDVGPYTVPKPCFKETEASPGFKKKMVAESPATSSHKTVGQGAGLPQSEQLLRETGAIPKRFAQVTEEPDQMEAGFPPKSGMEKTLQSPFSVKTEASGFPTNQLEQRRDKFSLEKTRPPRLINMQDNYRSQMKHCQGKEGVIETHHPHLSKWMQHWGKRQR